MAGKRADLRARRGSGADRGITQEYVAIEVGPDGAVAAQSGACSTGQSRETVCARLIAEQLEIPEAQVRLVQRDMPRTFTRPNGSPAARCSSEEPLPSNNPVRFRPTSIPFSTGCRIPASTPGPELSWRHANSA